eukprot:NODE_288_length_10680_cov_0.431245.p1 type:complete len:591 gc:universal NODE_288_length_10680_cov_0.431245:4540-6312(+)
MLANDGLKNILESNKWTEIGISEFEEFLEKKTEGSQAILGQFFVKEPKHFKLLFNQVKWSFATINYILECTNIDFYKYLVTLVNFKSFIQSNLKEVNSILKLISIVMIDQTILNQIIEWIGKDNFKNLMSSAQTDIKLKDLITAYYLAENTVGANSWTNPIDKASDDDIETLYLLVVDRISTNYSLTDLKSLMFLSSIGIVKQMIASNFSQYNSLFRKLVDLNQFTDINVLWQILKNVIKIPKMKTEQEIKMIQMKLVSMGVEQTVAFDESLLMNDENEECIVKRIVDLIKNYDLVFFIVIVYKHFYSIKHNNSLESLLDPILCITKPVESRKKLVADGLLKFLSSLKTRELSEEDRLTINYNISRLITNVNPLSIASSTNDLIQYIPMLYQMTKPAIDFEMQMQSIMALTNLCCCGSSDVLEAIFNNCYIKFPTFLRTFMTHEVPELRRVSMELFTNMLQCESFQFFYFDSNNCRFEDVKLIWLFTTESDKYLQFAALGAMAYLSYASHVRKYIMERIDFRSEILELLDLSAYKIEKSCSAVQAIVLNFAKDLDTDSKTQFLSFMIDNFEKLQGKTQMLIAKEIEESLT